MTPAETYGRAYYAAYRGGAYERTPEWTGHFANLAEHMVADIAPSTALDAGCAKGFLVEQLRDRGVDAEGVDVSEYAVAAASDEVRPHLRVASLTEPLARRYDVITCFEVLEHLEPADAEAAVANLCAHTDDILFSSTPDDFDEATHVNVQPMERWAELFLRHGFIRDIEYDAGYVADWAVRWRRTADPLSRQLLRYERAHHRLLAEKAQRDRLLKTVDTRLDGMLADQLAARADAEAARAEAVRLLAERDRLALDLRDAAGQVEHLGELAAPITDLDAEIDRLRRELAALPERPAYRAVRRVESAVRRAAPRGTHRGRAVTIAARGALVLAEEGPRALAGRVRRRLGRPGARPDPTAAVAPAPRLEEVDVRYQEWLRRHDPDDAELASMRSACRSWSHRPLVSILMPVYNAEPWYLVEAIESVRAQVYDNWELCIADDASPSPEVAPTLARFADDPRIRQVRRETNGGIALASRSAAELATGDLVGLLDHDDVLQPHALYHMVRHLHRNPGDDLVYSDEDKLDPWGRRISAHMKPAWSPELLESCNYVCHLTVMRRDLFEAAGGFREGYDGSQDYDLFLRCTERARGVGHVPEVLYSWRMVAGSAATSTEAKPAAYEAAKRALQSAMDRREELARVEDGHIRGFYFVRRRIQGNPSVAVVIPTRDRHDLVAQLLASIDRHTGPRDYRIVIVDNDSSDPDSLAFLSDSPHLVVRHPGAFNFSAIVNHGVAAAGDVGHVLLLNNDVLVRDPLWLDAMLEHSQRPEVGAVGARLLHLDGSVQHEGVRVGVSPAIPADNMDMSHFFGMGLCNRTVSAVTGAVMMVKRSLWEAVGGYDESLRVMYNDVDFCLRLAALGHRTVYSARAQLVHHHSASRGRLINSEDTRIFVERWGIGSPNRDPFVSPNIASYLPVEYA